MNVLTFSIPPNYLVITAIKNGPELDFESSTWGNNGNYNIYGIDLKTVTLNYTSFYNFGFGTNINHYSSYIKYTNNTFFWYSEATDARYQFNYNNAIYYWIAF